MYKIYVHDMKEFNEKWKVYSDNVNVYEILIGCVFPLIVTYADRYTSWLDEFQISYTVNKLDA